jgi:quercetin dioxygenase-like cupin family protein
MELEQERLRRAPTERFAGQEHLYDLAEVAAQLRAEPKRPNGGHRQITIVHHGPVSYVLFDFEAGGRLSDHVADGLVTIHVLAGRVEVRTSEAVRDLAAGRLLVLSPGVAHDLRASMPSQVLLTVHLEREGAGHA